MFPVVFDGLVLRAFSDTEIVDLLGESFAEVGQVFGFVWLLLSVNIETLGM